MRGEVWLSFREKNEKSAKTHNSRALHETRHWGSDP